MDEPRPVPEDLTLHLRWVERLAAGILRDPQAGADVAQDAWLASRRCSTVPGSRLRAWFTSVARNLARDERRRERGRARRETVGARPEEQPSTYEVVARGVLVQRVTESVMELEEPYRSTVLYRYFDGLSATAIAERTGATPATVRKRLSRGLAFLRKDLAQEARDEGLAAWLAPVTLLTPRSVSTPTLPLAPTAMTSTLQLALGTASLGLVIVTPTLLGQAPARPVQTQAGGEVPLTSAPVKSAPLVSAPGASMQEPLPVEGRASRKSAAPPADEGACSGTAHGTVAVDLTQATSCATCHLEQDQLVSFWSEDLLGVVAHGVSTDSNDEGNLYGGRREGEWIEKRPDESLSARGHYLGGLRGGSWSHHREDGSVESTGNYLYGKQEGLWRWYRADGELEREAILSHGRIHGLEQAWHPGGVLKSTVTYHYGRRDGEQRSWHADGSPASRGYWLHDLRKGRWEEWDEAGNLVAATPYRAGQPVE